MIDGLYKVHFKTPLGYGSGVVHLLDGRVRGGDAGLYYTGTYEVSGDSFGATVLTARHTPTPGLGSVFGVDSASIELTGTILPGVLTTKGTAAIAPGVTFDAVLTRIAD